MVVVFLPACFNNSSSTWSSAFCFISSEIWACFSAVLEERVQPGISLLLSGQLNHKKKDYKFGVGLCVGGA